MHTESRAQSHQAQLRGDFDEEGVHEAMTAKIVPQMQKRWNGIFSGLPTYLAKTEVAHRTEQSMAAPTRTFDIEGDFEACPYNM